MFCNFKNHYISLSGASNNQKCHIVIHSMVFEGGVNFGGLQLANRLSYRPLVSLIGQGIENTFSMRCFAISKITISLSGASNNQKCHIIIHSMVLKRVKFGGWQLKNRLSYRPPIGLIGCKTKNILSFWSVLQYPKALFQPQQWLKIQSNSQSQQTVKKLLTLII